MGGRSNFIDLIDSAQLHFNSIHTCISALYYISHISDDNSISPIIFTLNNATQQLEKLLTDYHSCLKK